MSKLKVAVGDILVDNFGKQWRVTKLDADDPVHPFKAAPVHPLPLRSIWFGASGRLDEKLGFVRSVYDIEWPEGEDDDAVILSKPKGEPYSEPSNPLLDAWQ